jgi:hypothetical protein
MKNSNKLWYKRSKIKNTPNEKEYYTNSERKSKLKNVRYNEKPQSSRCLYICGFSLYKQASQRTINLFERFLGHVLIFPPNCVVIEIMIDAKQNDRLIIGLGEVSYRGDSIKPIRLGRW